MGLGGEHGSHRSCLRPRAEGRQRDRAGRGHGARLRAPASHEPSRACSWRSVPSCPCPDVLPAAGPQQWAAGQPGTGISGGSSLLPPGPALGDTSEEPPSSPVPVAVPWGHQAAAAEPRPEGPVMAAEQLHGHLPAAARRVWVQDQLRRHWSVLCPTRHSSLSPTACARTSTLAPHQSTCGGFSGMETPWEATAGSRWGFSCSSPMAASQLPISSASAWCRLLALLMIPQGHPVCHKHDLSVCEGVGGDGGLGEPP